MLLRGLLEVQDVLEDDAMGRVLDGLATAESSQNGFMIARDKTVLVV